MQASGQQPAPAEPRVAAANRAVLSQLPFDDRGDFDDANRGFIATTPDTRNPDLYTFLRQEAPATVNPSLWRQAQLNAINGLFRVTEGVYQIRGFSLANMTIVEGATGVIVIDPLSTVASAREGLELYFAHRPRKPVTAVIYTHSHSDHYGGARGVAEEVRVHAGQIRVIAPLGFLEAVVGESVIGGNAMARRAQYQFGLPLGRGERGNVDAGLGKFDSRGAPGASLLAPTETIDKAQETRLVDGVEMVFQLAPASEAPAEMHIFLTKAKVLDIAENATHNMHNLLPLRGTEVRDANSWSRYLGDALTHFGKDAQVMIAQHHWPVWGNQQVAQRLANQRDLYKYIHDQSVRMMNQGYTPPEIAENLTMPPGLENDWSARGYYGTLSHNAKAVYQKYIGWYDGNPAHLNPLPPVEGARKYVEYMGGATAVMTRALADFNAGNYRWVAEVMNQVVFAESGNTEARSLGARAYEQMGYQSESATWRNAYLLAAQELRRGPGAPRRSPGATADQLHAMPLGLVFDYLGTRLNGPRAGAGHLNIDWRFTDVSQTITSTVSHGALTWTSVTAVPGADTTVALSRAAFEAIVLGQRTLEDAVTKRDATVSGDRDRVNGFFTFFDDFDGNFPIVEPRRIQ